MVAAADFAAVYFFENTPLRRKVKSGIICGHYKSYLKGLARAGSGR